MALCQRTWCKYERGQGREGIARTDLPWFNGKKHKFVNTFTWVCEFTFGCMWRRGFVRLKVSFSEMPDPIRLSGQTAVQSFLIKLLSVTAYSLNNVWHKLTERGFGRLKQAFTFYMKKALCLHRKVQSRHLYLQSKVPLTVSIPKEPIGRPTASTFSAIPEHLVKTTHKASTRYLVRGYPYDSCVMDSFHELACLM